MEGVVSEDEEVVETDGSRSRSRKRAKKARNAVKRAAAAEDAKKQLVLVAVETGSVVKGKGKTKPMETKEQISLKRTLEERSSASGAATSSASASSPTMALAQSLLGMLGIRHLCRGH